MKNKIINSISIYFRDIGTALFILATLLLFLFVCTFYISANHDSAWLLYMATQAINPSTNFFELFKDTLPGEIFFHIPPAIISKFISIDILIVFKLYIFTFLLLYLYAYYVQIKAILREKILSIYIIIFLAPVVFLPYMEFGQRDHLVFCFLLNYFLVVICRRYQCNVPIFFSFLAGISAALAVSLKPHYIVSLIALEFYLLIWHRSFRGLFRIETIVFALVSWLYFFTIIIYFPEVVKDVIPMLNNMYWTYSIPLKERILIYHACILIFVTITLKFSQLPERLKAIQHILAIGVFGSYIAFLLLGNIWYYRQYPFFGFSYVYIGAFFFYVCNKKSITCANIISSKKSSVPSNKCRVCRIVNLLLYIFFLKVAIIDVGLYKDFLLLSKGERVARSITHHTVFAERKIFDELPEVKSIFVLDTRLGPHTQIMMERGLYWGHRYNSLWMFPAWARVNAQEESAPKVSKEIINNTINEVYINLGKDLKANKPDAFVVNISDEKAFFNKVKFDYIQQFNERSIYFRTLFKEYRLYKTFFIDKEEKIKYAIYIRKDILKDKE